MAVTRQLEQLQKGAIVWNRWREQHQNVYIDLSSANLSGTNLNGANLIDANLRDTNFIGTNLSGADLRRANLNGADLRRADLNGANLRRAYLNGANLERARLGRADLSVANLSGAKFIDAKLGDADLENANLSGANLSRADLSGADLSGADLSGADLSGADFERANLSGADLSGADFERANLISTNLSKARVGLTIFGDVDLSQTKGLQTIRHSFPSTIGINTIYRSQGKIPEVFLRQAGVQESFIEVMAAITNQPIEYYTCFISYSHKDEELAERLYADLQRNGVRCWFAPEDLKIGDKFRARIDESIRVYDKLLLLLSEHALTSDWVEFEVEAAFSKEEITKRTVLFPIRLDTAVIKSTTSWAAHIQRTRHIGNFEHWKDHDTYRKTFERLLHDLKADAAKDAQ